MVAIAMSCGGCVERAQRPDPPALSGGFDRLSQGREVYEANCLSCHQADGRGVPYMQPPLWPSPVVAGDPTKMIEMTLRGIGSSEGSLPASGEHDNAMPAYDTLTDDEIAACLTYIRLELADLREGVSAAEVRAVRDQLSPD